MIDMAVFMFWSEQRIQYHTHVQVADIHGSLLSLPYHIHTTGSYIGMHLVFYTTVLNSATDQSNCL